MSLERIIREVLTAEWYISKVQMLSVLQAAPAVIDFVQSGHVTLDASAIEAIEERGRNNGVEARLQMAGDVAVIPLSGLIGRNLDDWQKAWGVDSGEVSTVMTALGDNDEVSAIVLDIDSPGGTVCGTPEMAATIAEVAALKPVFAHTAGLMCSAAYFASAGATAIYATASATVGNVGVIMSMLDTSALFEKLGLKAEVFASGAFKGTGAEGMALTEEQREFLQERVMFAADDFKEFVTRFRPNVAAENLEGQWFWGSHAVELGFVDSVASLAETIRDAKAQAVSTATSK